MFCGLSRPCEGSQFMFCLGQSKYGLTMGHWCQLVHLLSVFTRTRWSVRSVRGDIWCLGSCMTVGWLGKTPALYRPTGGSCICSAVEPPPLAVSWEQKERQQCCGQDGTRGAVCEWREEGVGMTSPPLRHLTTWHLTTWCFKSDFLNCLKKKKKKYIAFWLNLDASFTSH